MPAVSIDVPARRTAACKPVMIVRDGRGAIAKRRKGAPAGFFDAEARGLDLLRDAGRLRVPDVFEVDADRIILEDLGHGTPTRDYWVTAGSGLAMQHSCRGGRFGLSHPGFCGDSPQDNAQDDDGWRFFAERRLLPQMRRARDRGLIDQRDVGAIESVCRRLRELVPDLLPVLLHGDLWLGNLHVCGDGSPALIDASAVHFGWAEAELAMLTLFGSPPESFFRVYAEYAPLRHDWRERAPLYNLYHLLNHVNLFGTGYLSSLRTALATCT
jgi:protein-ribulosamine 3-kinase